MERLWTGTLDFECWKSVEWILTAFHENFTLPNLLLLGKNQGEERGRLFHEYDVR
jgi:hypothetical protein